MGGAQAVFLLVALLVGVGAQRVPTTAQLLASVPTTSELLSGVMEEHIRKRAGYVDEFKAQREAEMERAAQLAKSLAEQPAHEAPQPEPSPAEQKYVDVGKVDPASIPKALTLEARGANYPRRPGVKMPRPVMFGICPDNYNVRSFGAAGDGGRNDAGAIQAALSKLTAVYFPPGNYRISSNLVINKPTYFGMGAWLNVDAGVTVTFTQRPHKWDLNGAIFGGAGRILFTGAADEIHPDWFRNFGESDSDALQQASDACAGRCTVILTRNYFMNRGWRLKPGVGVFSTQAGQLDGRASNGEGVTLSPGRYPLPLHFGTIWGFSKFGIKIQGGVTMADIQLSTVIDGGGDAIVFAPGEGNKPYISNVFVTHFTATKGVQNTVVIRGSSPSQQLRNCVVRGNFVLSTGMMKPNKIAAALRITGKAAPTLVDTQIIFQAVEANQGSTKFVFIRNDARTPAMYVYFWVSTWGGGMWGQNAVYDGTFVGLVSLIRLAGGITSPKQWGIIRGYGNKVTWYAVSSAGAEYGLATSPSKGNFNGGRVLLDQVVYLNAPIYGTWKPGEVRTFWFYNVYAKTAQTRISCITFRAANAGIVCAGFDNQQDREAGRIAVKLMNAAGYPLPGWQTNHRFGVQVGP